MLVMKKIVIMMICCLFFVGWAGAINNSQETVVIERIDSLYTSFTNYIGTKTKYLILQRFKTKVEEQIRNTLLKSLSVKMSSSLSDDKLIYQVLWTKILQRKSNLNLSTVDIMIQWQLIARLNTLRQDLGLSPLSYNILLTKAAYTHAYDLYVHFPYDVDGD